MDIKVRFGNAVRRLRLERGHTQEGFAAQAKINRSYMGQIERGDITIENAERIAIGLGLTIGKLMIEVDQETA
jgi:transcriptional regulator with XRE-family HTH domain